MANILYIIFFKYLGTNRFKYKQIENNKEFIYFIIFHIIFVVYYIYILFRLLVSSLIYVWNVKYLLFNYYMKMYYFALNEYIYLLQ